MSFSKRKSILLPRNVSIKKKRQKVTRQIIRYKIHWIYPLLFFSALVCFLVIYLCQYAGLIRIQYGIGELKKEQARISKEKRRVKLGIEKLAAPERVEKIARQKLKMISPGKRIVLSLRRPTSTAVDDEFTLEIISSNK